MIQGNTGAVGGTVLTFVFVNLCFCLFDCLFVCFLSYHLNFSGDIFSKMQLL